jgi:hypothetical protein
LNFLKPDPRRLDSGDLLRLCRELYLTLDVRLFTFLDFGFAFNRTRFFVPMLILSGLRSRFATTCEEYKERK